MDKLLGFVCALLCAWNAEADVTGWTGTYAAGTISVATKDGAQAITLQSSLAVGATLFTVTATAADPIATYAFDTSGNPDDTGAIVKSGTAGVVTLAKVINYPTVKQVIFKVKATDTKSGGATSGVLTLTVNFGASTDYFYSFCVADPTPSGTVIGAPSSSLSTSTWAVKSGASDAAKFTIADGKIKTASKLESSEKVYYTTTLTLTDGTATSDWPLHVLVDNGCLSSGVAHVISGVAMIVMTALAIYVV